MGGADLGVHFFGAGRIGDANHEVEAFSAGVSCYVEIVGGGGAVFQATVAFVGDEEFVEGGGLENFVGVEFGNGLMMVEIVDDYADMGGIDGGEPSI